MAVSTVDEFYALASVLGGTKTADNSHHKLLPSNSSLDLCRCHVAAWIRDTQFKGVRGKAFSYSGKSYEDTVKEMGNPIAFLKEWGVDMLHSSHDNDASLAAIVGNINTLGGCHIFSSGTHAAGVCSFKSLSKISDPWFGTVIFADREMMLDFISELWRQVIVSGRTYGDFGGTVETLSPKRLGEGRLM